MTLDDLQRPGPARSAATQALARELRLGLSVCIDRAHTIAARGIDAAITAAKATQP